MPLSLELAEVRDFLSYLQLKNLASRTIDGYRHRLRNLFDDLPPELNSLTEITAAHLRCYVADLQAGEYAPVTIYHAVQEIKRFFAYLVLAGHLQADPARRLPLPQLGKRLPKALSLTEMEALLRAVRKDSRSVLRDRVLIELLYVGGFRISEVLSMTVADCDLGDGSIRVIGKGNNERRVYLKPPVVKRLSEYIEREKLSGLLFPGRGAKPLNGVRVRRWLKEYARVAGITRRVTPHMLRHSIAVHYLQGGAPINFVQNLLGHAKLSTTGEYLRLSDEMAKRIAIDTQTAVDRLSEEAKRGTATVKEARLPYRVDEFEMWDAYVSDALEWLA